jgi:ribose-phosphate pyrophosphokinase
MNIIGDVEVRRVILDDIDTGTRAAANALMEKGAKRVYACCTHAVLSGKAVELISQSPIEEMIVTDTVPLRTEARQCAKVKVFSISPLLAQAIQNIHNDESVSSLFV